ncbi:MAG TPA: class I SAM-dependent methyltransferase [Dehalococcoidia bacterium]|jgi:SAM-dependent methyltransferase|nr:class I SAM-dependent methyltransferase [Dehalococcoidia bacterium]
MTPEQVAARAKQLAGNAFRRFLQSLPGQMLANPPLYSLPREMLMQADHRVLEIGCGAGSRLLVFDQRVRFHGVSAAGVEPVPALARRAQRAFGQNARPLSAVLADPEALPFRDGAFDMAFCDDLLRFFDVRGAQQVLREAARVLRPGALLLAWDLAPASGRFGWWQRFWLRGWAGRIASSKSLMGLAERSGFSYTRDAALRPWFWPPVPRASFVAGTLPPGWRREGENLIPPE